MCARCAWRISSSSVPGILWTLSLIIHMEKVAEYCLVIVGNQSCYTRILYTERGAVIGTEVTFGPASTSSVARMAQAASVWHQTTLLRKMRGTLSATGSRICRYRL